jgi:hypothetical protein
MCIRQKETDHEMGYMTYSQSLQQTRFTRARFLMQGAGAAELQRYMP